jgi:hypothetical protein
LRDKITDREIDPALISKGFFFSRTWQQSKLSCHIWTRILIVVMRRQVSAEGDEVRKYQFQVDGLKLGEFSQVQ